jgi:hypothetical protein
VHRRGGAVEVTVNSSHRQEDVMDRIDSISSENDERASTARRDGRWKLTAAAAATIAGPALATTVATPVLGLISHNHNETMLD